MSRVWGFGMVFQMWRFFCPRKGMCGRPRGMIIMAAGRYAQNATTETLRMIDVHVVNGA